MDVSGVSRFDIIPSWLSMLIYNMGENNRPFGGLTPST
jgi:hypothetical protein